MNAPYTIISTYIEKCATVAYPGRTRYFTHNGDISRVTGKERQQGKNMAYTLLELLTDNGREGTEEELRNLFILVANNPPKWWDKNEVPTLAQLNGALPEILLNINSKKVPVSDEKIDQFLENKKL